MNKEQKIHTVTIGTHSSDDVEVKGLYMRITFDDIYHSDGSEYISVYGWLAHDDDEFGDQEIDVEVVSGEISAQIIDDERPDEITFQITDTQVEAAKKHWSYQYELFTPGEIADLTDTAESTWRNKANRGELRDAIKKGKQWLIPIYGEVVQAALLKAKRRNG